MKLKSARLSCMLRDYQSLICRVSPAIASHRRSMQRQAPLRPRSEAKRSPHHWRSLTQHFASMVITPSRVGDIATALVLPRFCLPALWQQGWLILRSLQAQSARSQNISMLLARSALLASLKCCGTGWCALNIWCTRTGSLTQFNVGCTSSADAPDRSDKAHRAIGDFANKKAIDFALQARSVP